MHAKGRMCRILSGVIVVAVLASVQAFGADQCQDREALAKDKEMVRAFSRAIGAVASEVRPAVVSVYTTRTVRVSDIGGMPFNDEFFREFFGRDVPMPQPQEREFQQRGLGSGFVIDAEKGYVLTNNHVVDGAEDIKVRVADDREFDATLVGADRQTDLAVVQIKADNLKAVKLGDSDAVTVGDFVLAVGSPFGLRETVSSGIVSAKRRSGLGIEDYEDFIQTDAAINVGNSGGPLVNIDAEVIGVNTAIVSGSGGSVGVGFAIPVNMAKQIVDALVEHGKVTRGWLGVMIQNITPDVAEHFGLAGTEGALISQIVKDTPAAKSGLKTGDVIVKYNGKDVNNAAKLRASVAATAPGSEVEVVLLRDGKEETVKVEIGRLPEHPLAGVSPGEAPEGGKAETLGLAVQDLSPELANRLGVDVDAGVVVSNVDPSGLAANKGIGRGDVITEVNRQPVTGVKEFNAALDKADLKEGVLLLVANRQGSRFVALKQK